MTPYKQKFIIVTESGKVRTVTVEAEDRQHGAGLALEQVRSKTGEQIYDFCSAPISSKEILSSIQRTNASKEKVA